MELCGRALPFLNRHSVGMFDTLIIALSPLGAF